MMNTAAREITAGFNSTAAKPLEEQNRQYVRYMNTATDEIDFLLKQGLKRYRPAVALRRDRLQPKNADTWNALVYNGLSWSETMLYDLRSPRENLKIKEIRDLTNNQKITFDIDEQGQALFVAARYSVIRL